MENQQTIGQRRVRQTFNPNDDYTVSQIKEATALLIDLCELFKQKNPRLAAIAQTKYEEAAMWAVKLATAE